MTSNLDKIAYKSAIKKACLQLLQERIDNAATAMNVAQETANNQEKSSVGDKYETARAMGQIDRDMNAKQLYEAQLDFRFVEGIVTNEINATVKAGSVFKLDSTTFFVAVGLGSIKINDENIIVISYKSPLFEQVKQIKTGADILFQNRKQKLTTVF
jgi:hypothetical protein